MRKGLVGTMVILMVFFAAFASNAPAEEKLAKKQVLTIAFDAGEVDMQAKIRVRMKNLVSDENVQLIETTAGRVVLSEILPDTVPFSAVNKVMNKKELSNLVDTCYRLADSKETVILADKLKDIGFRYANLAGISIPGRPNNFTVSGKHVKNINVGLKKLQGSYENSSMVWKGKATRIWITTQIPADSNGVATADSDLISPGNYQAKIFGDAADNASQVDLTMTMVKKMIVGGRFNLIINTTGFPAGNYSISVKAINGSLSLDELAVEGLSIVN